MITNDKKTIRNFHRNYYGREVIELTREEIKMILEGNSYLTDVKWEYSIEIKLVKSERK